MKYNRCITCLKAKHPKRFNKDGICRTCYRRPAQKRATEKEKAFRKLYPKAPKSRYAVYMRRDRVKGRQSEITLEEFTALTYLACHYCGDPGKPHNGLDRVDSQIGYKVGNVVPCCTPCNLMKRDDTHKAFIDRCKKIAAFSP